MVNSRKDAMNYIKPYCKKNCSEIPGVKNWNKPKLNSIRLKKRMHAYGNI